MPARRRRLLGLLEPAAYSGVAVIPHASTCGRRTRRATPGPPASYGWTIVQAAPTPPRPGRGRSQAKHRLQDGSNGLEPADRCGLRPCPRAHRDGPKGAKAVPQKVVYSRQRHAATRTSASRTTSTTVPDPELRPRGKPVARRRRGGTAERPPPLPSRPARRSRTAAPRLGRSREGDVLQRPAVPQRTEDPQRYGRTQPACV